ncbi:GPO family capsid scaffolding protein [Citrobacter sp. Cm046]|uniref:GPO family capsid scaffolding protein n=1 Tax=Citrobacter sp. Cm046 TaxID=2985118 RepID=UPI002575FA8D|nr:GPO family capsid scaffolding protein [Citrobacter sp. Cm046]MDM2930242.1 GPO family capsid scaffolding protein [Citrobacter sp. Cm046]
MTVKAKRFRIGGEGATTDGREIQREWLVQMAASYNPTVYTALINLEHIKSYLPESTFNRYGRVTALVAEEIQDGPLAGKMALYADIEPTDALVALVKKGQKLFTSMEVSTKFADTGKAYLVGLGATDDPASLGTEMLAFSASAEHNPLANRKQNPENLFSEAVETLIELEEAQDVTTVLDTRLMSLTLTDNRGFEADQLDLELDDADGLIVLPRCGAVITVALGWKGQPLFPKGGYTVDEIEHSGAPDRLTIRARSADFRETLNTRREKSWHQTTVGEVVKEIVGRHNLKMALGKYLTDKAVDHIDQTNESDASFLMRLARQYGAIASVKDGNLLFLRQGQGKTASGKALPVVTITRKDGDSHRFTLADRGAYTGVIASWLHTREPKKKEAVAVKRKRKRKKKATTVKEPEAKQGDYLMGTDENVLVLSRTYANRSNAERAAKMQWERLQRGVASFSMQLAEGRADLYTEMPVKVQGFKKQIDEAAWTITTLTHILNSPTYDSKNYLAGFKAKLAGIASFFSEYIPL